MEIIKEDQFRKQIKKGLSGGYLFFGDEDYLKSFAVQSVRSAVCPDPSFALFNDVRIDAMDYSASALLDALIPPPMMEEKKLVTVSGLSLSSLRSSELDDLFEVLEKLNEYDYNILILSIPAGQMEEGSKKVPSPILSDLGKYLTPVHFAAVSDSRLISWVGKHFQHHGVQATPEICARFIQYNGKSMFTLSTEAEKLAYYVLAQERTEIHFEDVEQVGIEELDVGAFALANAVLDGKYDEALRALEVMKFRRVDPVIVLSQISRVLCEICDVKALQKEGLRSAEIAELLKPAKIGEYKVRLCMNCSVSKSDQRLRRALQLCAEADQALKLSPQGYTAIERLIAAL